MQPYASFLGNIIHLMSDPEGNSYSWFCFPEGPDIKCLKCFVIFLDLHFNVLQQQKRNKLKRSESKQYDLVLIRTKI